MPKAYNKAELPTDPGLDGNFVDHYETQGYNKTELPADPSLDGNFDYYETQHNLPGEQEALRMLRRCARIVLHVMRAHGRSYTVLCEHGPHFLVDGSNLRHHPEEEPIDYHTIYLCLRSHDRLEQFLDTASAVQTLVHELAHIDDLKGPDTTEEEAHNLDFYLRNVALLTELEESVDRGDVHSYEVPTRATHRTERNKVKQSYKATPNDPRIELLQAEVTSIEPPEVRVYSRNTVCKFKLPPKSA